jgi:hypothetical protein
MVQPTPEISLAGTPNRSKRLRGELARFIKGHWHPVPAVGVYFVSLLALGMIVWARFAHLPAFLSSRVGLLLFGLTFLIPWAGLLTATIGAWLSLQRIKSRGGFLRANFAEAAQIVIILTGSGALLWSIGDVPSSVIAISQALPSLHAPRWTVRTRGSALYIRGEIDGGLADAINESLTQTPDIRSAFLDSPGGEVTAAMRIAQMLKARGISTVVRRDCASACTIIFSAGRERLLLSPGRLGFHDCRDVILWYLPCDTRNQENYMISEGVDPRFAQKALAVDSHKIWYPSVAELLRAHVVTDTHPQVKTRSQ